ncbi:MAG: nicotinate-nucleotide adenylyltransferase [Thermoguttaceae bacterium]|jgi:nicotinate-nucleotide adenylyltransferase
MKLGIFGGTFDPIHYGHLMLAECCREQRGLDAVWFLPAAVPPHKRDQELTPATKRIEMLKLAIAGNPAFSVCTYETDRGGVNYTVDTLTHIHEEEPGRELFFLMGEDMLLDLPHWKQPERVCQLALPVVVHRAGMAALDFNCLTAVATPQRIEQILRHQVEMPEIGLSGSDIRRRVAAGKSIRYYTPRAVEKYIETHAMYKTENK